MRWLKELRNWKALALLLLLSSGCFPLGAGYFPERPEPVVVPTATVNPTPGPVEGELL